MTIRIFKISFVSKDIFSAKAYYHKGLLSIHNELYLMSTLQSFDNHIQVPPLPFVCLTWRPPPHLVTILRKTFTCSSSHFWPSSSFSLSHLTTSSSFIFSISSFKTVATFSHTFYGLCFLTTLTNFICLLFLIHICQIGFWVINESCRKLC